jgi:hypothetical protein
VYADGGTQSQSFSVIITVMTGNECPRTHVYKVTSKHLAKPISYIRSEPLSVIELRYIPESVSSKECITQIHKCSKNIKYNGIIFIQNSCIKLQPFTDLFLFLHSHEHFVTIIIITMGKLTFNKTSIRNANNTDGSPQSPVCSRTNLAKLLFSFFQQ